MLVNRARRIMIRMQLLIYTVLHSERMRRAFYAAYCSGAILGAILRTSIGRPWATMLRSVAALALKRMDWLVHRIVWALESGLPLS